MRSMRIYLDLCALKRPYDEPVQDRVVLEALAVASIVECFERGTLDLIPSSVLELENDKNPVEDRRRDVAELPSRLPNVVYGGEGVLRRGKEIQAYGFRPLDALHLASAEAGGCKYFVTCDDRLATSASRSPAALKLQVVDPLTLVNRIKENR